ncbi:hypothetical protein HMPREF3152_01095 [Actinomyces sp. HMSC06A08]|nr:hypothetical protein HMPREF2851_02500 [Actinomyces sp. HMSC064C12]OFK00602.1 hypothetical protein HMPREF2835_02500 [Actinomyces sp. HMSC072A03]OFT56820.1 hypothetical protein HMPREF3152_01095 [Actinomyces sp. HMSC06A08]
MGHFPMKKTKRRRAVFVSEADRRRLAEGKTPSWDEGTNRPDYVKLAHASQDHGAGENDARLMENVPPHWGRQ